MVVIKVMEEMPTSCIECEMKKSCEQGVAGGWREDKRVDDCPLAEILTCKDCRHWKFDENSSILCGYCINLETETNEDFYCRDAERENTWRF